MLPPGAKQQWACFQRASQQRSRSSTASAVPRGRPSQRQARPTRIERPGELGGASSPSPRCAPSRFSHSPRRSRIRRRSARASFGTTGHPGWPRRLLQLRCGSGFQQRREDNHQRRQDVKSSGEGICESRATLIFRDSSELARRTATRQAVGRSVNLHLLTQPFSLHPTYPRGRQKWFHRMITLNIGARSWRRMLKCHRFREFRICENDRCAL